MEEKPNAKPQLDTTARHVWPAYSKVHSAGGTKLMSEGMFGGAFGKPVFDMFRTPPIVQPGMRLKDPTAPYGQPAQAGQPIQRFIQQPSPVMRRGAGGMSPADQDIARQMVQSQPKKKGGMFSGGGKGWDALAMISGTLRDLDGTMGRQNYAQAVQNIQGRRAQDEAKAKQAQQQAAMEQMLQGMTPEQRMAYQANPEAFSNAYVDNLFRERKPIVVGESSRLADDEGNVILDAVPETLPPITPYQVQQLALDRDKLNWQMNQPSQNGITIGADGTVQIGGPSGAATSRYMAGQDATQMSEARRRANDLQPVLQTLYSARAELVGQDGIAGTDDDLDTGSFAPIVQGLRKLVPGEQGKETRYDNFDALSKEFGIEKLSGIGGNDTERELLTAIETGPNMGAQEGSNIDRVNRQIAVFEFIGESRRNFQSRWLANEGSLSRTASQGPYQGMTFDEALSVFQREQAATKNLLGNTQSFNDQTRQVLPQRGDIGAESFGAEVDDLIAKYTEGN